MKILYVTTMAGHPWGGSEELWVKLANEDCDNGHNVFCSIFNWGIIPPKVNILQNKGISINKRMRFQYKELYKKPFGKLIEKTVALSQLKRLIKKISPDKIVISMGGFCDLEVDVYQKFFMLVNIPFEIIIQTNPEDYYISSFMINDIKKVCQKAEVVHFVSHRLMEIAIRQIGYEFPNGRLIKNPVNMTETGILPWFNDECIQMACVGRLEASVKGHPLFFQALSQPEWKTRNWHVNIYGEGPDKEYYKILINSFHLENKVTFCSFSNNVRQDIWAKNHILILPSYYEGLPLALVEAMACGRTAVVTDVGGNTEILKDNITGFIAEGVNMNSFRKALNRAWDKKDQWKVMGELAFNDITEFLK